MPTEKRRSVDGNSLYEKRMAEKRAARKAKKAASASRDAARRKSKGYYTKAELASSQKSSRGGDKKVDGATKGVAATRKTTAKGNTTGLRKVKAKSSGKVATKTQGVVTKTAKGNTKGLKKVAVPKTKKQERQQTRTTKKQERQKVRTQRKAKRAADARNEANKILKKTSGTGRKVTSRDQRKLKRLRGKYNRNTK